MKRPIRRRVRHSARERGGLPEADVVIYDPVSPEALRKLLRELRRVPWKQIVIVLPESALPALRATAEAASGAAVIYRPSGDGPGAGCAAGAAMTSAASVLFLGGSTSYRASRLIRFLQRSILRKRLDVSLNGSVRRRGLFAERDPADHLAEFLNRTLGRRDLGACSLNVTPFMLSRQAIDRLGPAVLAVPAQAMAAAALGGLRIGIGWSLPWRRRRTGLAERVAEYAEAWRLATANRGARLSFPDLNRNRAAVMEQGPTDHKEG